MKSLQKKAFLLATCYLLLVTFSGCATIIEGAKGIVGISTQALEDLRPYALKKTFKYNYNTCYDKVEKILSHIGAYVYAKDTKRQMIACYVSQEDTTPVGIFFKAIDANNTQLEVSSPSTYAKELIFTRVYLGLERPLDSEKKEGMADVKKDMQGK